jgi:hypothetical protein
MAIDTSYAERFSDWVAQQLDERNTEALLDYRRQHPDALPGPRPEPERSTRGRTAAVIPDGTTPGGRSGSHD